MSAIFFCHGCPGSAHDAQLAFGIPITAIDLYSAADFIDDPLGAAIAQFDVFVSQMPGKSVHVIGFSIGAMFACAIAAERPEHVKQLTLISAAAPLQLGDFLPEMAGQPVFKLAQSGTRQLMVVTYLQSLILRLAPSALVKRLFAGSADSEMALLRDAAFEAVLQAGLDNSFVRRRRAYVASICAYVSDWTPYLTRIACPVALWHGDKDNWAPLAMAHALEVGISTPVKLHSVAGAGHYSTLLAYRDAMKSDDDSFVAAQQKS